MDNGNFPGKTLVSPTATGSAAGGGTANAGCLQFRAASSAICRPGGNGRSPCCAALPAAIPLARLGILALAHCNPDGSTANPSRPAAGNSPSLAACHYPKTETHAPPHSNAYRYGCAHGYPYAYPAAYLALANPISNTAPNTTALSRANRYPYAHSHPVSNAVTQGNDYRVHFL